MKGTRPNTATLKRPSTAIRVNQRIAQLSVPTVRGNRLDRFGFDHPDLCNVVVPKTIDRLTECYEAIQNEHNKNEKCSNQMLREQEFVESELNNFEQRLRQISV